MVAKIDYEIPEFLPVDVIRDKIIKDKDKARRYFEESQKTGKEFGISFCKKGGQIYAEGGTIGKKGEIGLRETCIGSKRVATLHTHPGKAEISELPSPPDIISALYKNLEKTCIAHTEGITCYRIKNTPAVRALREKIERKETGYLTNNIPIEAQRFILWNLHLFVEREELIKW